MKGVDVESLSSPERATGTPPLELRAHRSTHVVALGLLLLLSGLIKFSVWQLPPQIFNDTPGYLVPALSLLQGHGYGAQENGFRSPTYPLVLAGLLLPLDRRPFQNCTDAHRPVCIGRAADNPAGQFALRAIVAANILFGLGVTVLLYGIGWSLTRSVWVAALMGASYALNISTAFWEISILTESLAALLLVLVLWLTLRARQDRPRSLIRLGLALGSLALCHALYLAYAVVPFAWLTLRSWRSSWRRIAERTAAVLVIPLTCIGGWSLFNYTVNGSFTPSTLSGYILIQMVYPVVQNAPEGYDGITQTLVGYRDAQIRQLGKPDGAVYQAWRDMMGETDLTWAQVSGKLTTLSAYLIQHYPDAYLDSVRDTSRRFWGFAFFHYDPVPQGIASLAATFTNESLQWVLDFLFWLASLALVAVALFQATTRRVLVPGNVLWGVGLLCATVWFAALTSSLTNLGDNERYRVAVMPLQYGTLVLCVWAAGRLLDRNKDWTHD